MTIKRSVNSDIGEILVVDFFPNGLVFERKMRFCNWRAEGKENLEKTNEGVMINFIRQRASLEKVFSFCKCRAKIRRMSKETKERWFTPDGKKLGIP